MPAKLLRRVADGGSYCHIFNGGLEGKAIFSGDVDYKVFQDFLSDYLSPPKSPEKAKKVFMVKGHSFHGVPHQPKNYVNAVELIAYALTPNRFDLVLRQINKNSVEKFMRSLSTRYSIYFNKKNHRTGVVFAGPYKSEEIKNGGELLSLTRTFHSTGVYSSLPDYLGQREASWVKPRVVLYYFEREKNKSLGGFPNYKDYVEKYEPEQKVSEPTETSTVPVDQPAPSLRISEIAASFAVFLVLLGLGLRNIHTANASINTSITQTPTKTSVLSESTSVTPTPSPSHQPKITVVVKTGDQSATVNIRKEPSTNAPVIGKATNGQTFEMVSIVESAWYEVKLEDGSVGYITSKYIVQQPNE